MFTFDNTTIIASVVLILVAVLTSLFNPFFRRVGIVAYGLPSSTNESDDTSTEEEPEEEGKETIAELDDKACLLYTSPSPRDPKTSRMPSSA